MLLNSQPGQGQLRPHVSGNPLTLTNILSDTVHVGRRVASQMKSEHFVDTTLDERNKTAGDSQNDKEDRDYGSEQL